jgi:hypothetical protein
MTKTAIVHTNDKDQPRQDLVVSGQVEKFVTIRPRHVSLRGFVGDVIKGRVTIIPEKKYPFKILSARAKDGKNIKFELKETKQSDTTAYAIHVENLKPDAGRYHDAIILQTDSQIRSQLDVRVYGYLRLRKTTTE